MIEATVVFAGAFVDRPKTFSIRFDEADIAMERRNETTGKFEQITVGDLYEIYRKRGGEHIKDATDPEEQLTPMFFEEWFHHKHIANKFFRDSIISQTFKKV